MSNIEVIVVLLLLFMAVSSIALMPREEERAALGQGGDEGEGGCRAPS
jgi:uncharacterized membrane protein YecN with MAPEG domain